MTRIHVGTCSWADHDPFYPEGLPANQQISYYAERFTVVEINSTYYALMPKRNMELWAERTPPGFMFDVKPYKQITWHDRKNPPEDEQTQAFAAVLQPLRNADKLGAVHFQFPPWFVRREDNLDYILHLRELFADDRISVEFRHRSWYEDSEEALAELLQTFRDHAIGLTVVDEPQIGSGSVPTLIEVTNPELTLVRFHGRNRQKWYAKVKTTAERFDYVYSGEELAEWAPRVRQLAEQTQELHLLFNNNAQDYAVQNGRQLRMLFRETDLGDAEVVAPREEGD